MYRGPGYNMPYDQLPDAEVSELASELTGPSDEATRAVQEVPDTVKKVAAPVMEPKPTTAPPKRAMRVIWLGVTAWLVWGFALGLIEYHRRTTNPPPPARTAYPGALALHVERNRSGFRVSWNHGASVITRATAGVLEIRDGDASTQELYLTPDQLHILGSVAYAPASGSVEFRLAVTDTDRHMVRESVLALMPRITTPSVASSPSNQAPATNPPPIAPAAKTAPVPGLQMTPTEGIAVPPIHVEVTLRAPPNQGAATAPDVEARAIRQVQPVVPPNVRTALIGETEVAVTVRIDVLGQVSKVQAVEHSGPQGGLLIAPSVSAAQRWIFEPARRGDRKISSDMILRFRFRAKTDKNTGK
jgi:hypothetical protein